MPRTDAGPQPRPRIPDRTETADLSVAVCSGSPLVVEIRGEIDIQSAPELRDELLRVIRRCGPELALDLAGVTFMDWRTTCRISSRAVPRPGRCR